MLTFEFTDLRGNVLKRVRQHGGGEADLHNSDSSTAKVTLSVYDPIVQVVKPLKTMLRVYLDRHIDPVFWGVVLFPVWDSPESGPGTVEVNAHDPSLAWKRNYHRYGDAAVDIGYPLSGVGLRTLAESAIPLPSQMQRGIPGPGILWGTDNAEGMLLDSTGLYVDGDGPRPVDLKAPKTGDGLWSIATRGQNVKDTIDSMQQAINGPEWRFRFKRLGFPGYYCYLDTSRRFGTDKSDTVVFHKGSGRNNNLKSYRVTPDGNLVRNYFVETYPGGEQNRSDSRHKGLAHSEASWLEYGIYEGWESSGSTDPNSVLLSKARLQVAAYKEPVETFDITPKDVGAPKYLDDFIIGDVIRATVKDGFMLFDLKGRVQGVKLTQPPDKPLSTTLVCVPEVGALGDTGDPGA